MGSVRAFQMAWDDAEPAVFRVMLRVIMMASLVAASPFLALALLFWLLGKPLLWWIAIPLAAAGVVLAIGFGVFLAIRSRVRGLRRVLDRAAQYEADLIIDQPPPPRP